MLWSVLVWYVNPLSGQDSPIRFESFLKAASVFALGKAVLLCKINRVICISKDEKWDTCSHELNNVGLMELCCSVGWLDTWSAPKIKSGPSLNIALFSLSKSVEYKHGSDKLPHYKVTLLFCNEVPLSDRRVKRFLTCSLLAQLAMRLIAFCVWILFDVHVCLSLCMCTGLCMFGCTCIVVPHKIFRLSLSIWWPFHHSLWKISLQNTAIILALQPIIFCRLLYLLSLMNLFAQFGWVRGDSTRNCVMSCQMCNALKHCVEIKQMGKHSCCHTAWIWWNTRQEIKF